MSIATEGMPNPRFEFGDRIRKVRRDVAHMTQDQMASALGVTQKAYAAWESGGKPGDLVAIARLVEQLWPGQVTAAWIIGVDEPTPPRPPAQPFRKPQAARVTRRLRSIADVTEERRSELVEVNEKQFDWYQKAIAGDVSSGTGKPVGKSSRRIRPAEFAPTMHLRKAS